MTRWASAVRLFLLATPTRIAVALAALAIAIGMVKYGISLRGSWELLLEAARHWQNPTEAPAIPTEQDFVLASAGSALLAGMLGLTAAPAYLTFQVILTLVALALPFLMPAVRQYPATARLMFVMIVGGSLLPLLLDWVAGYDALTVIGASLAVLARRRPVVAAGWALMAFNHTTLTLVALAAWLPVYWLLDDDRPRAARAALVGWPVGGLLLGAAGITLVTTSWGGITSRADVYAQYGLDFYVNALVTGLPLVIFTALGVGWVVLLDGSIRRAPAVRLLLIEAVALSILLPLLALDQTRTITLAVTPALFAWIVSARRVHGEDTITRLWKRYALPAAIIPVPILIDGVVKATGWQDYLSWRSTTM